MYKTANKGWAVRSWDHIPAGAIVCPYLGEIVHESELTNYDVYVLDLDTVRTAKLGSQGREVFFWGGIRGGIRGECD